MNYSDLVRLLQEKLRVLQGTKKAPASPQWWGAVRCVFTIRKCNQQNYLFYKMATTKNTSEVII
jgi:hypothetical protein